MRKITALALACLCLDPDAAAAQSAPAAPEAAQDEAPSRPASLRFTGSDEMGARLIPDLGRRFLEASGYAETVERRGEGPEDRSLSALDAQGDEASLVVSIQGPNAVFPALRAGEADLGMVSRPARVPGAVAVSDRFTAHVIGLDAVAVVVHPDNPLRSLTLPQIRNVFSGRTADWSRLDSGLSGPIRLMVRNADSGSAETFRALAMEGAAVARSARRFATNADLAAAVSRDPQAIGFLGGAPGGARPLAIAQDCGLLAAPDAYSVKTEEYPLARRLLLYRDSEAAPSAAEAFVEFSQSAAARPALKAAGFVDLEIVPSASGYGDEAVRRTLLLSDQAEVGLADMQEFARFVSAPEAQRLSVTFRFAFGGSELDERATLDVSRLAEWWLAMKRERPRLRLAVLGFTDSLGPHDLNRGLARNRARAVADRLQRAGVKTDLLVGWGEVAPVACDWTSKGAVDEAGQSKNRRVEIWIY